MKTQGTDNNAATAKATRDSSSRGEVTTDPAAKTLIEAKTFTRAATTTATAAPVDGTMVRAETPISTSRAGVLRREYRLLCAAATRHETDWKSLLSPLLHSTSIAAGTQRGYANREYGNRDDRRRQQQQHRRRRPGDDEGRPHTTDRQARVFKPDWMCPRGCGVVFGSKSNCFKCGSPREAGADEVPADVVYGGVVAGKFDWVCNVLGCTSVNFARRSVCFTCLVPKGPLATKVDQSDRPGAGVRAVGIFSRTGSTRRARGKPPTPPRLPRGVSRRRPANNPWTRRPTPRGRPRSSTRAPTRRWRRRGATNNMRWSRRRTRPPRNNTRNNNTRNNPGPSRKTRRRRPRRRGGRSPRCPAPSRTRRAARLPSPRSNRAGTCTTRTPGTTRMRRPACGTTPTRV